MLKTPSYWYRQLDDKAHWKEYLFAPLSALFQWGAHIRRTRFEAYKASIPVICVGNLVTGGSGKTPTAIALYTLLKAENPKSKIYFLTRGYGGIRKGPLLVEPSEHIYREVGDEALLLSNHAPTIISRDRAKGAQLAEELGADIIIMDDGLQNPTLHKDIRIMVINGEMGFGNQKTLPSGPLREPLETGFEHVDLFILIGEDTRGVLSLLPEGKPVMKGSIQLSNSIPLQSDAAYLAFAGMGYPEKFFNFLKDDLKLNVVKTESFPDHHPFRRDELKALHDDAQKLEARLITTSKDMARLPLPVEVTEDLHVDVVNITLKFDQTEPFVDAVHAVKASASA